VVSRACLATCCSGLVLAGMTISPGMAQTPGPDRAETSQDTVFVLGRMESSARDSAGETLGGASVGEEDIRTFARTTVDEAVDLVPGVAASTTGGARNERILFIRGFDRFQTTLSIDGVRVFLPADNRIDFGRFLTADIAEIQVSKGYVSVLDGPGGLGGAINLVTRRPARPFELEVTASVEADRHLAQNGTALSGLIGMRRDGFYLQASGAGADSDGYTLPARFRPTVPALEDGGERINSGSTDWRVNLKAGFTPNDTDEYALSWTQQSGEKNAPYHVYDTASTRFWTWPYWDTESLFLATQTRLADGVTLRTRVYRNAFDNLLSAFDSASQTTQSLPRAFNSYYADESMGATALLSADLTSANTLKAALHFRRDRHREQQDGFIRAPAAGTPFANLRYSEPDQTFEEDIWTAAVEHSAQLTPRVDLVTGLSYEWTNLRQAEDVNVRVAGATLASAAIVYDPVRYPKVNQDAVNAQAALSWRPTEKQRLYASVSSRARFPTLFERFSQRLGAALPNPDIRAEQATSIEIGGEAELSQGVRIEGALFHSDITDGLIFIPVQLGPPFGTVNQTKNAADGDYTGAEAAITAEVSDALSLGGNYTFIERDLTDPTNRAFRPVGVPKHKLFAWASWRPVAALTISPNLEWTSERWTVTSSALITPPRFYETGSALLANLSIDWTVNPNVSLLLSGSNLTDVAYQLVDGFPEEGRAFRLSLRYRN
jgi:iron complex outermembrane recepter protein